MSGSVEWIGSIEVWAVSTAPGPRSENMTSCQTWQKHVKTAKPPAHVQPDQRHCPNFSSRSRFLAFLLFYINYIYSNYSIFFNWLGIGWNWFLARSCGGRAQCSHPLPWWRSMNPNVFFFHRTSARVTRLSRCEPRSYGEAWNESGRRLAPSIGTASRRRAIIIIIIINIYIYIYK